jgi:hypothetical protein
VQRAWKQDKASVQAGLVGAISQEAPPPQSDPQLDVAPPAQVALQEDASRYCPVCSQRLESRRCKLICAVCGYYMSCADYY